MSIYRAWEDRFMKCDGTLDEISENVIYPNLQNHNCM